MIATAGDRTVTKEKNRCWVNIELSNREHWLDRTDHSFHFFKYTHRDLAEAGMTIQ